MTTHEFDTFDTDHRDADYLAALEEGEAGCCRPTLRRTKEWLDDELLAEYWPGP